MAYTPINWQTGDEITAVKMNKMDNGWSVETATQTLFNDSVTTESSEYGNEAEVSMTQITADTVTVTFGGQDYTCTKIDMVGGFGYGGVDAGWNFDFTEYPFAIISGSESTFFVTETAGTFSFKIESAVTDVEISDGFTAAVNKATPQTNVPLLQLIPNVTEYDDALTAYQSGQLLYFHYTAPDTGTNKTYIIHKLGLTCEITPTSSTFEACFPRDGGTFYINPLT